MARTKHHGKRFWQAWVYAGSIHRSRRSLKRDGYIVKGISDRHWWDRIDKDRCKSTRGILKADLRREMRDV